MWINTDTLISITQANNNLNLVLELIEKFGSALILKNNLPVYWVNDVNNVDKDFVADMPRISFREASRNFSNLTYLIYDSGYAVVTKNRTPVAVFFNFDFINTVIENKEYLRRLSNNADI